MFFKRLSPNRGSRGLSWASFCTVPLWWLQSKVMRTNSPTDFSTSLKSWANVQVWKFPSNPDLLARLCFQSKLKTIGVMGSVWTIKFQINIFIPNSSPLSSLSGFCYLPGKHSFIRLWRTPFWAWSFCFSLECTREMSEFALESLFVIAKVFFEVANLIFGEYTKYRKKEKEKDNRSLFTD